MHDIKPLALAVLAVALQAAPLWAGGDSIILQSTTSTQNSGLYEALLPQIAQDIGLKVEVVAVGTGQALKNGQNCDGDALLVHAKSAEEKFVAAGYGVQRFDVMYNDFVIVGPTEDPAHVAAAGDAVAALRAIAQGRAPFASRGDDSGTNKKELALWTTAGLDPMAAGESWYRETGSGMGATLNIAAGMGAYTLTDRATWISFGNKTGLKILSQGDPALFNQYGVIAVNPAHCPSVNAAGAQRFIDWILSPKGQAAIAAYRLDGQQLFFADAKPR